MKTNFYKKGYNKTLNYSNSYKEKKNYINYFSKNYGQFIANKKDIRILDIGCGNGLFLEYLKGQGYNNILGIDLSQENIIICKGKGLNVLEIDVFTYLNRNKEKFDLIVMNDIIEHILRDKVILLLKLIKLNLRNKGILLIKTLNMSNPVSLDTLYCDFTHQWGYSQKSIEQICFLAGFKNVEVKNIIIYPNISFLDWIFPFIYKLIKIKYKMIFTFYGKKGNNVFSKNLLCIAKNEKI